MWTTSPSNRTSPESAGWMPAMHLINVDLPAPLSPTSAITSPSRTSKSTSVSACTEPKLLLIPRTASVGATAVGVAEVVAGAVLPGRAGGGAPTHPPPVSCLFPFFCDTPQEQVALFPEPPRQ